MYYAKNGTAEVVGSVAEVRDREGRWHRAGGVQEGVDGFGVCRGVDGWCGEGKECVDRRGKVWGAEQTRSARE